MHVTSITSVTEGTLVFVDLLDGDAKKQQQDEDWEERWQSGVVLAADAETNIVTVKLDSNESPTTCKLSQLYLRNIKTIEAADDITTLAYLHEASLLSNLLLRYQRQEIYTYVGTILIAVNPFQRLNSTYYGLDTIEAYRGQPLGKLSPHVYAIAEDAYRTMLNEKQNQSILVSGESGAGKTETTKYLLKYFAAMGGKKGGDSTTSIEGQVLSSTPILEAFGNAKTLRNDNSSRFGKFIEIQFNSYGSIVGAVLRTYLLEKSRIVRQATGERNYHIFYQFLAGCPPELKAEWNLGEPSDYYYLNQSSCIAIDGVDDAEVFQETKSAMKIIGITEEEQTSIMKLLAAILHLSNITFEQNNDTKDSCRITDETPLNFACQLLQVDPKAIGKTLLTKTVSAGRETYVANLTKQQAETARDSMSMLLYSKMFDWLVRRMNENINSTKSEHFIGILDIYGFESFETNSFEQFCINFANEKLQQQYNQHVFKLSQQEYVREKINWTNIEFNDNQPCLDLIEKNQLCILNLLDEECRFPKSNEKTFAEKLYNNHTKNPYFEKPRFSNVAFTIKHYADRVTYDCTSFLDKNRDYLVQDQITILEKSPLLFLQAIFKAVPLQPAKSGVGAIASAASKLITGMKAKAAGNFTSVSSQFKDSLQQLMDTINSTYPHYIRCVKPNQLKLPNIFNKKQTLTQLKCGGILESIRICLEGYPTKLPYQTFWERYRIMAQGELHKERDPRKGTELLVVQLGIEEGKYQFGITKLFLRAGQIERVERERQRRLNKSAVMIQKNFRRFLQSKRYKKLKVVALNMQCVARIGGAKQILWDLIRNRWATVMNKFVRRYQARKLFLQYQKVADTVQRLYRGHVARKQTEQKKRVLDATKVIQCRFRGYFARKNFHDAIKEAKSLANVQKQKEGLEVKLEELKFSAREANEAKQRLEDANKQLLEEMQKRDSEVRTTEVFWSSKYTDVERQNESLAKEIKALQQALEKEKAERAKAEKANAALQLEIQKQKERFEVEKKSLGTRSKEDEEEIAKIKQELEREKKRVAELQRQLKIMHDEKEEVKKRKESEIAYDVDKALVTMVGDVQEKAERFIIFLLFESDVEFCNNVVPLPAFLIYNILRHTKGINPERIMTLVANTFSAIVRSCNDNKIYYWFANILGMIQLFCTKDFLTSFEGLEPEKVHEMVTKQLKEEPYVTFDEVLSDAVPPGSNAFLSFMQQLVALLVRTYCVVVQSLYKRIAPLLKGSLLDTLITKPNQGMMMYGAPQTPRGTQKKQTSFQDLVDCLFKFYDACKKNFINQKIVNKLLMQGLYFIDTSLFNDVLLRKELCTSASGLQLKLNTAIVEQSVTSWTGNDVVLTFLRQAAQMLMMDKNLLQNNEVRVDVVPNLNNSQIHKLLQMYTYDEFETPISEETFNLFAKPGPALVELPSNNANSLLLKTRMVLPFETVEDLGLQQIEGDLPYLSFPITMKDRLEKMSEEKTKTALKAAVKTLPHQVLQQKEQEKLQQPLVSPRPQPSSPASSSAKNPQPQPPATTQNQRRTSSIFGFK